jgi:hypothetical protein
MMKIFRPFLHNHQSTIARMSLLLKMKKNLVAAAAVVAVAEVTKNQNQVAAARNLQT